MPTDHFRALSRRPVNLPATLSCSSAGWKRNARLVDLGLGGACVEVKVAPKEGSRVTLRVTAPTLWDALVLEAQVAWLIPLGDEDVPVRVGMRFDHGTKPPLNALVDLLCTDLFD